MENNLKLILKYIKIKSDKYKMVRNYQNAKIYKIIDNTNNNIYIGSTCEIYLSKRLQKHLSNYKAYKIGKYTYTTSFKIFENNNFEILLLETYPCNNKYELELKEREYIENNDCLNKVIPTRTQKEYREDNKEQISKQRKEHYNQNKEKISEQYKKYYQEYYEKNKEKIKEKKKAYYENNKEKILEKEKEYREKNKEKRKEYDKKYYYKNLDKEKERKKKYYLENKEKILLKNKKNIEKK